LQIFIDSANINDIKKAVTWGIADGITTNQKIFMAEKGVNFEQRSRGFCEVCG